MKFLLPAKKFLRDHAGTRDLYLLFARKWLAFKIPFVEWTSGRYFTAEYFDNLYTELPDPWTYRNDSLSEERRRLLLEILQRRRYHRLLEVGCAEGWITAELAKVADEITALEISEVAIERARKECDLLPNVIFYRMDLLLDPIPTGSFDCIVCAGVLNFFQMNEQPALRDKILTYLEPGGDILLEHGRHPYPGQIAGREIHDLYTAHPQLELILHQAVEDYAITVLRKRIA